MTLLLIHELKWYFLRKFKNWLSSNKGSFLFTKWQKKCYEQGYDIIKEFLSKFMFFRKTERIQMSRQVSSVFGSMSKRQNDDKMSQKDRNMRRIENP